MSGTRDKCDQMPDTAPADAGLHNGIESSVLNAGLAKQLAQQPHVINHRRFHETCKAMQEEIFRFVPGQREVQVWGCELPVRYFMDTSPGEEVLWVCLPDWLGALAGETDRNAAMQRWINEWRPRLLNMCANAPVQAAEHGYQAEHEVNLHSESAIPSMWWHRQLHKDTEVLPCTLHTVATQLCLLLAPGLGGRAVACLCTTLTAHRSSM